MLVKSFALETRRATRRRRKWIETRFLTKQEGEWYGYTYRVERRGTDATLVGREGLDQRVHDQARRPASGKQTWHYPSRAECMVCHSRAANFVLGLCEVQMNKDHDYRERRRPTTSSACSSTSGC